MSSNDKSSVAETSHFDRPRWLNEGYFYDILDKNHKNYKIDDFSAKSALQPGENYTSTLIRVNIKLKLEDEKIHNGSYLVKANPETNVCKYVEEMNPFPKEIDMYTKILPKFEEVWKEFGKAVKFGPKCMKVTSNPYVIVMEDLKIQNFINQDRQEGLDAKYVEAVLTKLAKLHAVSAYLYEKEQFFDEKFHVGVYKERFYDFFKSIHKNVGDIYQDCMTDWPSGAKYADQFGRVCEKYFDRILDALQIDWNSFNVLNHGDLWSNNIMFQHDEFGNIRETYFVDFQLSKWGSPSEDLQYFLISSCNYDLKIKEFDNFVTFYYNQLVENLKLLQYPKPVPRLDNLQNDLLKRGFLSVSAAIGPLSAAKLDTEDNDASMDNYVNDSEEGNNFKRRTFSNPRYVQEMEALLPFFESRRFLD